MRFALARLGAVCVATNAMAAGPEITHYAEASRATAAITQASFAELVSTHARNVRWVVAAERESYGARYALAALFAEPAATIELSRSHGERACVIHKHT